ncbi:MAG TPA: CarD family transcriptional regulator [Egibacteraceae bacterium]|nr:CarD family transcriptional regulator [Egibacteraceae bacterium]
MGYAQGETVVHPQHGAAVVEAIFTKDLGQGPTEYLELHIEFASLKILVPAASVEQIGIRSLSSRKDAEAILSLLEEKSDVPVEWAERNATTIARMKSLELDQIAMIVRDLTRHERRLGRPLNMGERTVLGKCLGLLARELSLSLGMSEEATMALLVERSSSARAIAGDEQRPASLAEASEQLDAT